jgi:glutathione peroxidase
MIWIPQENGNGEEILKILKHVRPGNGFEPKFTILEKGDVNGPKATPLFKLLRAELPYPHDRTPEMDMESPYGIMKVDNQLGGQIATPSDVKWNFEKFLVDHRGVPRYRFSPKTPTKELASYIEELLKEMDR